jgi:hypothetical protein
MRALSLTKQSNVDDPANPHSGSKRKKELHYIGTNRNTVIVIVAIYMPAYLKGFCL